MKKLLKYLTGEPKQDMTIKSLVMGKDMHAVTQPTFARLNRAGRTAERVVTLGGIFLAVSTGGVGVVGLGLAVAAKGVGLAAGAALDKTAKKANKKLNPFG